MATLQKSPKINLRTMFFLTCVTLIVFCSCALAHTDVTAEQARDLISSTNDLVVVDVREPYEYCDAAGHIPGTLNYPLSSGVLEARFEELPKDGPVLVVCRSGGRSNQAANFLDSKGFSMVYDMLAGMSAWIWDTVPCKDDVDSGTGDSAETNTYVFLSGQSTVVQTGGIAGVNWNYSVEGYFQLTVDKDAGTGSFTLVDANAIDDSPFERTLDPNHVFNMTSLLGKVLDETTISFMGIASDGSDIHLSVTLQDDLAYLVGHTTPPPNTADFFLFSLDAIAQRKYGGGTGEPNDPYQIATADDLMLLGDSSEDYDKHFIMTADIDLDPNLPGRKVFDRAIIAPNWETPFAGVFDGNGYTISHLAIVGESYLGLFGLLEYGAEVRNLGVVDVNITGTGSYLGGLGGANGEWEGTRSGVVSNCYTTGVFSGTARNVGGVVGLNLGTVTGCYSAAAVSGDWHVGGLIGWNPGTVIRCQSGGTISGEFIVGGLVGANGGNVTQCRSTASVSGADEWVESVGGLVGASSGTIAQCYSTAKISSGGGLVGSNGGFVTQCYSTGMVGSTAGGLVGSNEWATRGGTLHVGHLADSLWDIQTSGQTTSAGGIGKTTAEMQTAGTFLDAGWDFVDETQNGTEDIWWILEGQDYPRLWWEKYSGGTGEPNIPYIIATADDLMLLGETPEDYDKHFILTADIDLDPNLPGRKVFDKAVIAPDTNDVADDFQGIPFTGVFDGNGHIISHLVIDSGDNLGLFGYLGSGAQVRDLGVVDVNITGSDHIVGGIAGSNGGSIATSYSSGSIKGKWYVGGLIGGNNGNLIGCSSNAVVSGDSCVGGLVGVNGSHPMAQCSSTGMVSGVEFVGGLIGLNGVAVMRCYSTSTVSGTRSVGGLVGQNEFHGDLTDCYSAGEVDGVSFSGGLVGRNISCIERCYSTALVNGDELVGGLVGSELSFFGGASCVGRATECFWDIETSGQNASSGGVGKTTAEMQTASTFLEAGWDFVDETGNCTEDIWWILEGQDYPRLWWEPFK